VLLEIVVLHDRGTLEHIRQNRSQDPSFYANLDKVDTWCTTFEPETFSKRYHILQEIKLMLKVDALARPTAKQLLVRMSGYDIASTKPSIFGDCCANVFVNNKHHMDLSRMRKEVYKLQVELSQVVKDRDEKQADCHRLLTMHQESNKQLKEHQASHHYTLSSI
jgi:hypothetical protein